MILLKKMEHFIPVLSKCNKNILDLDIAIASKIFFEVEAGICKNMIFSVVKFD